MRWLVGAGALLGTMVVLVELGLPESLAIGSLAVFACGVVAGGLANRERGWITWAGLCAIWLVALVGAVREDWGGWLMLAAVTVGFLSSVAAVAWCAGVWVGATIRCQSEKGRSDKPAGRSLARPVALVLSATLLAAGGAVAWHLLRDERDERNVARVVAEFRDAVNASDFERACSMLASTAPLRASGGASCPAALERRKEMVAEWQYILPGDLDANVEARDGARVRAVVFPADETFFDGGPTYRFTFVEEDGRLRLERLQGSF